MMHTAILRRRRSGSAFASYAVSGSQARMVDDPQNGVYAKYSGGKAVRTTWEDLHVALPTDLTTGHLSDGTLAHNAHNLLLHTADFSSGAWSKGANVTVTADAGTAPDGTTTADRYQATGTSTSNDRLEQTLVSGSFGGLSFKDGFWVKSNTSASQVFRIKNTHSGVVDNFSSELTATTEWQFFDFEVTNGAGGTGQIAGLVPNENNIDLLVWGARLYRTDLPMQPVPEEFRIAGDTTYVETTSAARYLPFLRPYRYDGSSWVKHGIAVAEAATQLLHDTDALTTQTETVTAQPYTLHFSGSGSITLSGAHSATLNGTGSGEENRVSLTFTPSAGTLTITPSGTIEAPQLEAGSVQTPFISNPASSGSVARPAFNPEIKAAHTGYDPAGMSILMKGEMDYADEDTLAQEVIMDWDAGSGNRVAHQLYTNSTATGQIWFRQSEGAVNDDVFSAGTLFSPGVGVPFNIASRHTAGDVNGAAGGTALSANTTVTALPDLSATNLELGPTFNGVIDRCVIYPPLDDTKLEAATS